MARYKFLFIWVLLHAIMPISLHAQGISIAGKVIDASNHDDLVGAVIKCGKTIALTNAQGEFTLQISKVNGSDSILFVSYIGYDEFQMPSSSANTGANLLISLKPVSHLLNQTLVTANRSEQSVKRVMVSTEIIQPYLIQNKNTTGMDKLLDQVPSVNVIDGQVNIRSGSGWTYGVGSRVMVLLDDMPFLTGDAGQVKWNFIPIENVQQVEVVKGASSVLYGSSALSGIVHFRTELAKDKPITRISAFSGVYSNPENPNFKWTNQVLKQYGASAFHTFKKNNLQVAFSGNYLRDEGYRMGENDNRLRLNTNLKFTPKTNLIYGLNAGALISDGASFLLWDSYKNAYTSLDSQYSTTKSKNFYFDPSVTFVNGNLKQVIRGRWMYISNDISSSDHTTNQDNSSHNFYGEYLLQRFIASFKMSISGGLVTSMNLSNSPLYSGTQNSRNHAAYLQIDQSPTKKLNLSLGARYEYFNMNGKAEAKPVFRAGVNYEMAKATFLRASFGQGYRFPSIAERYVQTNVGLLNVFPNPQLQSETGWNAELGAKQGFSFLGVNGFLDAAVFYTRYQNMIDFNLGVWKPITDPFNPFPSLGFKSLNIGETQIVGTDLSLNAEGKIGKVKLQTLFGYTYTNPTMLDPNYVYAHDSIGNPYNYRNTRSDSSDVLKYRFKHLLKWDIQVTYKKWQIGYSLKYNSSMQNIDAAFVGVPLTIFIKGVADARYANRNGNTIMDARIAYQINSRMKIALVMSNILNAEMMTRPADMRPPRLTVFQYNYSF